MTNRRYDDDEVAVIFQRAAEGPQTPPLQSAHTEGMTLAELQEIGREVGISPEAVASAARSLDVRPESSVRTFLNLPIGVERAITLDRRLTETEWEQLVVALRAVFKARGSARSDGSLRQWTNGNLQALLEPTATGHRLRLSTVKGSARISMAAGTMLTGVSAFMAIAAANAGQLGQVVPVVAMMSVLGIGMVASTVLRLPAWARQRARQMEAITSRLSLETSRNAELPPSA